MLKNKKKLRRVERHALGYVVTAARTLVLAGMVMAPVMAPVMATEALATNVTKDTSGSLVQADVSGILAGEKLVVTANIAAAANVTVTTGDSLTILGGLDVLGAGVPNAQDYIATLQISHDSSVAKTVTISGVNGAQGGVLLIDAGTKFTSVTGTTVASYGKLEIKGIHDGVITVTGASDSVVALWGTQVGNVILNGDAKDSVLTSHADSATVQGNVVVTKGSVNVTTHSLTVSGALTLLGEAVGDAEVAVAGNKTLTVGGDVRLTGGVVNLGEGAADTLGTLQLTSGKTLTIGTGTGTAVLKVNSGTIEMPNVIKGAVVLKQGTIDTSGGTLCITNVAGTDLGHLTLGTGSVLTLDGARNNALVLGKLTVNTNTAIAGMLLLEKLDAASTGTFTLNGGAIAFKGKKENSVDATLYKAPAAGKLNLGNGGSLAARELTLSGFGADAIVGTGSDLSLKADRLILEADTTFGNIAADKATTVSIRSATTGSTVQNFINKNVTLKGYAGNAGLLALGSGDTATGTATTSNTITLLGAANANEAMLTVDHSKFVLGTVNVGSATDAATNTGSIIVSNGGTMEAKTVNLYGVSNVQAATLKVGNSHASVNQATVGTLNVGGTAGHGVVTVDGESLANTATLKVTTALNVGKFGAVTVGNFGTLDLTTMDTFTPTLDASGSAGTIDITANGTLKTKNMTIADTQLKNASTAGAISVAGADSLLHVDGKLTLVTQGADVSVGVDALATVQAKTLDAQNASGPTGMKWTGGTLVLRGTGTASDAFTNAAGLSVNGGNATMTLKADDTNGGTYAGKVTVTDGTLNVAQGTWKIGQLAVANGENASIGGNLIITGTTSTAIVVGATAGTGSTGLNVRQGGSLEAHRDTLLNSTLFTALTGLKDKIFVAGGGLLKVNGIDSITLNQAKDVAKLMTTTSKGMIQYVGTSVTVAPGDVNTGGVLDNTVKGTAVEGTNSLLKDHTVGYAKGTSANDVDTVTVGASGGFGAKDLLVEVAATAKTLEIMQSANLTLLGGGVGSQLVKVTGANNVATNITVASDKALNLGSAGLQGGGTLNGNVTLAGTGGNASTFNVTNGVYGVKNITGTANDSINIVGGTLSANAVGTGQALALNVTAGSLITADTANLGAVTLKGGGMQTTGEGVKGDLTTGVLTTTGEKNTIVSNNDLTIHSFTDGTADGATAGTVKNTTFVVVGDMTVSNAGSNLNAEGVTLHVGGALKTAGGINAGNITAGKGSHFTVGSVSQASGVGIITVSGASSLTVGTLTGSGGVGNFITIGTMGDKTDGSVLKATKTDLGGGILSVLNATAFLGELTATAGTIFVDPAYVNIGSVTGNFGANLLVGDVGVVTVGAVDSAWVQKAIADAKAPADSSVLALQKGITLSASGSIVVDETVSVDGNINGAPVTGVYFGNRSLLAIDGSQFLTTAAITADGTHGFVTSNAAGDAARLHITSVKTGDTVKVLSGLANGSVDIDDATKGWKTSNISFDSQLFWGEGQTHATNKNNFDVLVHNRGTANVFPKLSASMGGLVDNVMSQYGLQTDHANAGVRFVSRAVSDSFGLGGNNAERAAATIEGAAQMGAVAGVQISTIGATSAASGAVTTRTSFAQPLMDMTKAVAVHQDNDGILSLDTGLNAGNGPRGGMKSGLGVWIMPLYQSNKTWGQKAENFKSGMSSDLGGIALGADYTINDMFRLGTAFNVGGGFGQSSGDFNKTENRFNFWGVNLYGGWAMNNFGLSADVGYTSSFNAVEQDLPSTMQMGKLKADVTSSAWQAGLKGEYKFETSVVDIIPHVGVRYMGLTTDGYDVKSNGTVFSVEREFQSIWTFPVGVAFSKTFTSDSGPSAWTFKPSIDLTVIPAAGDLHAKSKARIPGVGGTADMKMQVVDAVTFDGGLGFEVGKGDLSFGLNYNIQASEHRTGHGVFGTLRYEF